MRDFNMRSMYHGHKYATRCQKRKYFFIISSCSLLLSYVPNCLSLELSDGQLTDACLRAPHRRIWLEWYELYYGQCYKIKIRRESPRFWSMSTLCRSYCVSWCYSCIYHKHFMWRCFASYLYTEIFLSCVGTSFIHTNAELIYSTKL